MNKGNAQEMRWREAIEFLLRLASIENTANLREGDRINLIDDLRRFLQVEGEGRVAKELEEARSDAAKLTPVIDAVRQIACAAADHKLAKIWIEKTLLVFDGTRMDDDRLPAVFSDGELRDVVAEFATGDFGEAESWQIGRCEWGECGKLFLADRKGQIFCSHRCANFASSARYQKRKKSKERKG